jgi:hypothetical protein
VRFPIAWRGKRYSLGLFVLLLEAQLKTLFGALNFLILFIVGKARASVRTGIPLTVFSFDSTAMKPIEPLAEFCEARITKSIFIFNETPDPQARPHTVLGAVDIDISNKSRNNNPHVSRFLGAYCCFASFVCLNDSKIEVGNNIIRQHFGAVPQPDFISRRLATVSDYRRALKADAIWPILNVTALSDYNGKISPQLPFARLSTLTPLDNGGHSNNGRYCSNVLFKKITNGNDDVPTPSHKSPVSAIIFIIGTLAVFWWGKR